MTLAATTNENEFAIFWRFSARQFGFLRASGMYLCTYGIMPRFSVRFYGWQVHRIGIFEVRTLFWSEWGRFLFLLFISFFNPLEHTRNMQSRMNSVGLALVIFCVFLEWPFLVWGGISCPHCAYEKCCWFFFSMWWCAFDLFAVQLTYDASIFCAYLHNIWHYDFFFWKFRMHFLCCFFWRSENEIMPGVWSAFML